MTEPTRIAQKDFVRSRWKNGLGYTDQIAIEPPQADLRLGNYLWRVSTAQIESSSDFSVFPNHDRLLVILSGGGVRLSHLDEENGFAETVDLPQLEPYEFPGDLKSRCELTSGAVKDLSVFFRKGMSAGAEIVHLQAEQIWSWEPQGRWNLIFVLRGSLQVQVQDLDITLSEGEALRQDVNSPATLNAGPSGSDLILIHLQD